MSSFSYIPQLQCDNVLLYPDLYVIRVYLVKDKILSPQCKNAKKIYYVINIFRKVNFSWIEYGIEKFSHVHFNGDLELIFFFFFFLLVYFSIISRFCFMLGPAKNRLYTSSTVLIIIRTKCFNNTFSLRMRLSMDTTP